MTKANRHPYEYRQREFVKLLQAAGNGVIHKGGLAAKFFIVNSDITATASVSKILHKMEDDGIITREINVHRTKSITLTPAWRKGELAPTDLSGTITYRRRGTPPKPTPTAQDRESAKILAELVKRLDVARPAKPSPDPPAGWQMRRPDLTARVAVLEKEIEERDRLIGVLRERVETISAQKEALRKQFEKFQKQQANGRGSFALEDLLTEEEKDALHSLLAS